MLELSESVRRLNLVIAPFDRQTRFGPGSSHRHQDPKLEPSNLAFKKTLKFLINGKKPLSLTQSVVPFIMAFPDTQFDHFSSPSSAPKVNISDSHRRLFGTLSDDVTTKDPSPRARSSIDIFFFLLVGRFSLNAERTAFETGLY